jgi:hypothetical protein
MAMAISIECSVRCTDFRTRAKRPGKMGRVGARLAAVAVATAALVLMAYGEHWLLQQAPATPSELAAATYAVDALSGGAVAVDANANDIHPNAQDVQPNSNDLQPEDKDIAR